MIIFQIDLNQVGCMVDRLEKVKSVETGDAELVLGGGLMFFTRVLLSDGALGQEMRSSNNDFTLRVIGAAMSMMIKNTRRDLQNPDDADEDDQKFFLSKACVDFLWACSANDNTRSMLRAQVRVLEIIYFSIILYD